MYFASSIALLLFPLILATTAADQPPSMLRKLKDPTISFQGDMLAATSSGIKIRQTDPCATLEVTYQRCLNTLSSTGADSCVDCVNDIWPDGDEVLCSTFHDFACTGSSTCSSCGQCQEEISEWLVCIHDNGGCTPQDCIASPGGGSTGGGGSSTGGGSCPGGSIDACLGVCLNTCE